MPCITELYHHFYIEKVKTIIFSIYNNLTPVALALELREMVLLKVFLFYAPIVIQSKILYY